MRTPDWLAESLGRNLTRIRSREVTFSDGVTAVARDILSDQDMSFAVAVMYAGKRLRRLARSTQALPQQPTLFPDLPGLGAVLEIKVNQFKSVAAMTAVDWDGALTQIETKERSATAQAERVRAAYRRIRPLLTTSEMTTADVISCITNASRLT